MSPLPPPKKKRHAYILVSDYHSHLRCAYIETWECARRSSLDLTPPPASPGRALSTTLSLGFITCPGDAPGDFTGRDGMMSWKKWGEGDHHFGVWIIEVERSIYFKKTKRNQR